MEVIDDDDELYRRLIPTSVGRHGGVTCGAYYRAGMQPDPEVSVNIARLSSPEATLVGGAPGSGVGVITARVVRTIGLEVRHAPVEGNYAHAVILGAMTRNHCSLRKRSGPPGPSWGRARGGSRRAWAGAMVAAGRAARR